MNKLFKILTFLMAATMSFFSPVATNHAQGQCCAECVMKREDEIEIVYEDEDNQDE